MQGGDTNSHLQRDVEHFCKKVHALKGTASELELGKAQLQLWKGHSTRMVLEAEAALQQHEDASIASLRYPSITTQGNVANTCTQTQRPTEPSRS